MDISGILEHYASITQHDTIIKSSVMMFGIVWLFLIVPFAATIAMGVERFLAGIGVVIGVVVVWAGVFMGVTYAATEFWPNGTPGEKEKATVTEITDATEAHYGVDLEDADVRKAWKSQGDRDVLLVGGVHDGVNKSLGIQVNEDKGTVIVYEGNVELEPVK